MRNNMINSFKKSYTVDMDGNLLYMATTIFIYKKELDGSKHLVEITAHEFDQNREKYSEPYYEMPEHDVAFQNFKDFSNQINHRGPNGFIDDLRTAYLEGLHGASLGMLLHSLVQANLFCVLTARSTGEDNLKRGIIELNNLALSAEEKILQLQNIRSKFGIGDNNSDEQALQYYFDINRYLGVNNRSLNNTLHIPFDTDSEIKKTLLMDHRLDYHRRIVKQHSNIKDLPNHSLMQGFSDDSPKNTIAMLEYYINPVTIRKFPEYKLYAFQTGTAQGIQAVMNYVKQANHYHGKDIFNTTIVQDTYGGTMSDILKVTVNSD